MSKYPRVRIDKIAGRHPKYNPNPRFKICRICRKFPPVPPANRKVTIEYTHMRGDDDVLNVHQACIDGLTRPEIVEKCISILKKKDGNNGT